MSCRAVRCARCGSATDAASIEFLAWLITDTGQTICSHCLTPSDRPSASAIAAADPDADLLRALDPDTEDPDTEDPDEDDPR
jgi:hypothetical protein